MTKPKTRHMYNKGTKKAYCGEEMTNLVFLWGEVTCPACLSLKPVPYEKEQEVKAVKPEEIDIEKLRAFGKKKGWRIRQRDKKNAR
jgi:hypothetical protein